MAGRSVGEVSATLAADTRKFISEVKRVTDKVEQEEVDINVGAEIDEADLQRTVQQVQDAVDRADADIDIGADIATADLDAALDAIRERIEGADSDVDIGGEINTDDLDAALADVAEHIENADADVGIGGEVDTADINAAVEQIKARLDNEDVAVDIGGEVDTADLRAALADVQEIINRADVNVDIGGSPALADLDAALADVGVYVRQADIEASIGGSPDLLDIDLALAEIGVIVSEADFAAVIGGEAALAEIDAALGLIEGEVAIRHPEVDIGGKKNHTDVEANLDLVELEVAARHPEVDIGAKVDTSDKAFTSAEAAMTSWAGGAGAGGGKSFSKGFSSGISDGSEILIAAVVALGADAATALEGALGGAVAVVATAVEAAGGAAGAFAGIATGLGGSLAAVLVGAQGVSGAFTAIKEEIQNAKDEGRTIHLFSGPVGEALSGLTPNAQAFAVAWADIHTNISDVKSQTQEALFAGLAAELQGLSDETIPDVGTALETAAGWANSLARGLFDVANDTDFTGMMEALDPAMQNISAAIITIADTFEPFILTTAPAAEDLAGWLEDGATALHDFVINNPEKMTEFFQDGVTKLEQWGSLLGTAVELLGTITSASSPTGGSALDAITGTLDRWETFLSGDLGKAKMDEFFGGVEETWTGMDPLFEGLSKAWGILTEEGTAASFSATMTALGDAMPAIAEALGIMGDVGLASAFSNIIQTFEPLLDLIGDLPDELLASIGQMYAWYKTVQLMDKAVDGLLKTIQTAQKNPWMIAVAAALTVATAAMSFFGSKEDDAREATDQFGDSLQTAITGIVNQQTAVSGASAAMEAMDQAFLDTTKNNDKVTAAMLKLDVGTDGAAQSLLRLHEEGDTANEELVRLAENVLHNQTAAEGLAAIVGSTDDNFAGLTDRLGDVENYLQTNNLAYDDNADSLQELADSSGVAMDIILEDALGMSQGTAEQFAALAESTGIPIDALLDLGGAMEEMSDQGEKIDFQAIAKEQLTLAATGDESAQAMLRQAMEAEGLTGSFDHVLGATADLVPLFQAYINELYGVEDATDAANTAALGGLSGQEYINSVIQDGIALQREKEAAAQEASREAYRAYRDEQQAAKDLLEAVREVATGDFGLPESVVNSYIELGEAFDRANAAADAFASTMEVLLGGAPGLEQATSDMEDAFDHLSEEITETVSEGGESIEKVLVPAIESTGDAFDLAEPGGRAYSEVVRELTGNVLGYAESALRAGEDTDTIIAKTEEMRAGLEAQLALWGFSEQGAADYIDTLLGTPEVLETVISTPNLLDALLNAEDLTVLYDAMGDPVITEFEALGIDVTEEQAALLKDLIEQLDGQEANPEVGLADNATEGIEDVEGELGTLDDSSADPALKLSDQINMINALGTIGRQVTALNDMVADPTIKLTDYIGVVTMLGTLQTEVKNYDTLYADPNIQLTQYSSVHNKISTLISSMGTLNGMSASPHISLPGIWDRISEVHQLQTAIDNLHGKTVTIHVAQTGSTSVPGLMAGGIVDGPGLFQLGERGMREAVVPLDLPLSRIDPTVRELAALMRGQGGAAQDKLGPRVQLTQYITPLASDPVDVSIQVVNRIAALIE